MKKVLKITLIFFVILLCNISVANAATNQELIAYASKEFKIAGETVKLTATNKRKVERYLNTYPVSAEKADQIIKKIDEGVALMNAAGVSNPKKLSKDQKDKLLTLAKEAASIAGATLTYESNSDSLVIYVNGTVFDKVAVSGDKSLAQTGTDYSYVVYTIAGVAVVAVAAVVYRKNKKSINA